MEPSPEVLKAGFSKSLDDCDQRIRDAFPLVRKEFCASFPGHDLRVDYTYRSPAVQFELFKKGRSLNPATGQWELTDRLKRVTDKDGVVKKGEHNFYPSKAADIYITVSGTILWPVPKDSPNYNDVFSLYVALGHIWGKHGVMSGAVWPYAWKDEPHVQVA